MFVYVNTYDYVNTYVCICKYVWLCKYVCAFACLGGYRAHACCIREN